MAYFNELYHQINWHQAWYKTLVIPSISHSVESVFSGLNSQLAEHLILAPPIFTQTGLPIQFVAQSALPTNTAYESFIGETGNICTRDNIHDLLNGLIWLNFPKTKAVLNYLHILDIAQNGITTHRSLLRNALTLFDENGGIVVSSESEILIQFQQFKWENALFENREKWQTPNQTVQFFSFGHALLEKLISPRKNITSHVLLFKVEPVFFMLSIHKQREKLDNILAEQFLADYENLLQSKNFQPLPVMGITGFCADNQAREFYQDKAVFRPTRPQLAKIYYLNLGENSKLKTTV